MRIVSDCVELGLCPARWEAALSRVREFCAADLATAAAVVLVRGDACSAPQLFGRQRVAADGPAIRSDALFLVASITKPVLATAFLRLVEQGRLALLDRVVDHVPEFGGRTKYGTTLLHLLTHTSGLPDMLPNNRALREEHAPLSAFVEGTCGVAPQFSPGHAVHYQSTGFALLGEIVRRTTGLPAAEYLRRSLFEPLGMTDSALGAPDSWFEGPAPVADRIVEIRVPPEQEGGDAWNWNSRYWRMLGAPWGGLLASPLDLARFASFWLRGTQPEGAAVLAPATRAAAVTNRLAAFPDLPEAEARCRPWGLGWRLNWPAHAASFGDFLGPRAYGHWGATGTLLWIDPDRDAALVLLTTRPLVTHDAQLVRLSNAFAAAIR